MSKRILSLVLALVMVLGTFGTVFAANTVEKDAATFLKEAKILLGDDKGDLNLDLKLERRDMVVLLSRLMGDEDVAKKFPISVDSPTWKDARTDAYYIPFYAWAQVNKFFAGNSEKEFAPRAAMTAQDYAVVLLRVLGYEADGHEAWKAALADAKKLGILENVVVEDATVITRGQMSVMTLNALGVVVKDSTKTLAEVLSIGLPTPAVLKIDAVVADNLKEVKVAFNKDVDVDLTDVELFSIKGLKVTDASVEDDMLVLAIDETMVNKKAYELVIKGTAEVDGKFAFTALDNAIPEVVSVQALGTKAVKVTMSEPVKGVATKNFKLDGKSYFGAYDVTGREIILTPYGEVLTVGEHKLTIASLEDFAGFKSLEAEVAFEVLEDKVAPEVVSVTGTLERLVVTFSEDVDNATVTKNSLYWNVKANTGTPVRLAGNKYAFEFANSLPIYEVTLNIQGVKDYSGNAIKAVEIAYKGELDVVRPEVVEASIKAKADAKVVTVKFSKTVQKDDAQKLANYTLTDEDGKVVRIASAVLETNKKDVTLSLYNSLAAGKSFTLKVEGVRDTTKLQNTMLPFEGKLTVAGALVEAKVLGASGNAAARTINVMFSKEMDMNTIANLDNYIITVGSKAVLLSAIDDVELEVIDGGRAVLITLPAVAEYLNLTNVSHITVIGARDLAGNLISNYNVPQPIIKTNATIDKATASSETKVVVEFNQAIVAASTEAFSIMDMGGNVVTSAKVTAVEVDGTKNVTLTIDKLPTDAYKYQVNIADGAKVKTLLENNAVPNSRMPIIDKIAPSIVEPTNAVLITTTGHDVQFTLVFDEDLTTGAGMDLLFAQDIKIVRLTDTKVLERGIDFTTSATGKNITVTILAKDFLAVASDYAVSIDKTVYIRDIKGNAVNESDELSFVVTEAQANEVIKHFALNAFNAVVTAQADKTQSKVNLAQGEINSLVVGSSVRSILQARLDAVVVVAP